MAEDDTTTICVKEVKNKSEAKIVNNDAITNEQNRKGIRWRADIDSGFIFKLVALASPVLIA